VRVAWAVIIWAVCYVSLSNSAFGKEFKGVSFPDEVIVGQTPCHLMGVGIRDKFFVNIYYGALYLQHPTHDPSQVIASDQPKRIVLHVVYKQVEPEKWTEGWQEGFSKNTPQQDAALKNKIDQFIKCFTEPVTKGEEVQISYFPGTGTEVSIKGQVKTIIPGKDFMAALWSIWFGKQPVTESLMRDMLGN
jgi:hypothetical protein